MKTYEKFMRIAICLFIFGVAGMARAGSLPNVIYVNEYAAVPGTGSSWANAYTNLQSALDAAVAHDQIWVAQGTYYPGTNLMDTFALKPDVGLYGGFAGIETSLSQRKWQKYVTTLSADIGVYGVATDNIYRVVTAQSATNAALDGFYITGGNGSSSLPLYSSGAGMKISGAPLSVSNCCFSSNNAQDGGAVWSDAAASFRNCIFQGNSSRASGGAINAFFNTTLDNCVFHDNSAPAGTGGAIFFSNVYTLAVNNCTFTSNSAQSGGFSIYVLNRGTALIRNSIFWNANHAVRDSGGGIWVRQDRADTNGNATLVDVRYSDILGGFTPTNYFFSTNNINQDPLFVDAANRDLHIQSGSPCKDNADPANVLTPDFDGVVRPTGVGVDMGAYEYTAQIPGVVSPVTGLSGAGDYAKIILQWQNASSTNFRGVLVLYYPTNTIPVGVPADGVAYQVGQVVGSQKVGYFGPGDDATPGAVSGAVYSNLPPDTTFTSAVYAYDHETNYSAAVRTDTTTYGPPDLVYNLSAVGGDRQVELMWGTASEPIVGVLVLRHRDSAPTSIPVNTQVYQAGDMIGDDVVAYVGPGSQNGETEMTSWTNTGLAGGTLYYYHVYGYDAGPNYSAAPAEAFADTFAMKNVTNAVDISLDHYFKFRWTNPDEADMRGFLILRGDTGFASASPVDGDVYTNGDLLGGSTVVFQGPVSNITPNAVSGWMDPEWFSAKTTRYYTFYAYDVANKYGRPAMNLAATTAADTTPPDPVTGLSGTPAFGHITLNLTNPNAVDFRGLLVVRDTEPITWLPTPGASYLPGTSVGSVYVVYIGPGNNGAIPGVANDVVDNQGIEDGVRYYYRVCSIDEDKNYSTPADTSVQVPAATKIYVNDDAAGENTGRTWANAFTNLQTALTNWVDGKQIWVAQGVYHPSTTGDRSAFFSLQANMALYGGFAGNEEFLIHRKWTNHPAILSGDLGVQGDPSDNSQQIVRVPVAATGSVLDGFTIENAYGGAVGAGIYIGAVMLVQNCIIQTNYGSTGGMHTDYVKSTVRNTIFRGNHGTYRGGALQVYGGWGQNPVFENCLFCDNMQDTVGGAMSVYHGPSTFRNCAFINNMAPDGNCAYLSNFGAPAFYNCILWDTGPHGNGIWIKKWNNINEAGQSSFYNCLMREDMTPPDPPHFGSSYVGAKENCLIGSDPLFVNEAGKDFHLQPDSPGIDAADTANSPTDDMDGNLRPGGLASDIGPYEIIGGRPLAPGILFMLK